MVRDFTTRGGRRFEFWRCRNTGACAARPSIGSDILEEYVLRVVAEEAVVKLQRPKQHSVDLDKARARFDEADSKLAAFEATWVEQGLEPKDAVAMRKPLVDERDAAAKALSELPLAESPDFRQSLRPRLEEHLLSIGFTSWEEYTAEVNAATEKMYAEGMSGGILLESLRMGAQAQKLEGAKSPEFWAGLVEHSRGLLRQVLKEARVSKGNGLVEERVEAILL
jgi:hypothetical protein